MACCGPSPNRIGKYRELNMNNNLKRIVVRFFWMLLGRKRLVRFARMLTRASRLDGENQMGVNGELLVIDTALKHARGEEHSPTLVDCGANVGDYSIQFARRAKDIGLSKISLHLFEPASATLVTLRKKLSLELPGLPVVVNQAALSDSAREMFFYVVHDNAGVNSQLAGDFSPASYTETVSVNTLENYCKSQEIEKILLLKIDTEGNDYNVLAGAKNLLMCGAIDLVQFEYNYRWIYARRYLRDVFELICATDMRLGKVTAHGIEFYEEWHPELETFTEGNYLLCGSEWVQRFPKIEWWGEGLKRRAGKSQNGSVP